MKNFVKKKIKILSLKKDKKLLNQLTSTSDLAFGFLINAVRKIPESSRFSNKRSMVIFRFYWENDKKFNGGCNWIW